MNAIHMIARARGVAESDRTPCAYCLESPFGAHGDLAQVSEAVLALRADPSCDVLCRGCRSVLEGKPGSQPPPLRMQHVLCTGGTIVYPTKTGLRDVVVTPPPGLFVVSWATSQQKHHVLHAGVSSPDLQRWGSDDGTIIVRRAHVPVLLAVEVLLAWHSRRAVLRGAYGASMIVRQGAAAWQAAEATVAAYRGQRVLDLFCAIARADKQQAAPGPLFGGCTMQDPIDVEAAELLACVARCSARRAKDGITFWNGGYFRSRIQRHGHRPLREMFSRLMDELGCSVSSAPVQELTLRLDDLDAATTHAVETALRGRAALLVAMTYDRRK